MDLSNIHNNRAKANTYELIDRTSTNGISNLGSDINAYNSYGMTPVHVALQAGAERELDYILSHPDCDPMKKSARGFETNFFANILVQYSHDPKAAQEIADRMITKIKAATYWNGEIGVLKEQADRTPEI